MISLRALLGPAALSLALALAPAGAQERPSTAPLLPMPVPVPGGPSTLALPSTPPASYLGPGVEPDLAFGAFQRGLYITALRESMKRIESKQQDAPAMTLLGELYKDGLGVRRDPREATRWYKLAAERGDAQGAYSLALAYLRGQGVAESRSEATAWLEKAAAKNHSGALYNLGLLAIDGDIQNFERARQMFARAAELGNMDAAYAVGLLYKEGRGVPHDAGKAAEWFRKAADEGVVAAQVDYAVMLFNGEGTTKDEAGAARYFAKAAATNNPVAANRLARLYVTGRGVPRNVVEGMKWHLLARSAGLADEWLDSQMTRLTPTERNAVDDAVRKHVSSSSPPLE